jgi:hypothetical protein
MPLQLIAYSCTVKRSTMVFKPAGNVTQFERLEKAPTYQKFGCTQKLTFSVRHLNAIKSTSSRSFLGIKPLPALQQM